MIPITKRMCHLHKTTYTVTSRNPLFLINKKLEELRNQTKNGRKTSSTVLKRKMGKFYSKTILRGQKEKFWGVGIYYGIFLPNGVVQGSA